jgi:hypothetical protein
MFFFLIVAARTPVAGSILTRFVSEYECEGAFFCVLRICTEVNTFFGVFRQDSYGVLDFWYDEFQCII